MRKPTFCIREIKGQLRGYRICQRICFRYINSTNPLPKIRVSVNSSVVVQPDIFGRGRKPRIQGFSSRSSINVFIFSGEASPSNLHLNSHWRFLPGNENLEEPKYVILDYIHHFLPRAKIIIIFRDPVERFVVL